MVPGSIPGADQSMFLFSRMFHSPRGECRIGILFPTSPNVSTPSSKCLCCVKEAAYELNWPIATCVPLIYVIQRVSMVLRVLDHMKGEVRKKRKKGKLYFIHHCVGKSCDLFVCLTFNSNLHNY